MGPELIAARRAIAHAFLGARQPAFRLGAIDLLAHQRDAVHRLRAAMDEFGGALLADDPGMGKTYVALALAREAESTIVVAPAALRAMWSQAAARAGATIAFLSHESLSRRTPQTRGTLVIVDEAHHARNPATRRYGHLAALTAGARVLLMSATPVRNRQADMSALLALFLGPRGTTLRDDERARCMVRRDAALLAIGPAVDGPRWHHVPPVVDLSADIAGLPPALPALDGSRATELVAMTLARCWSSSLVALDAALRRRLQRGIALEAILDAGRMPTRRELRAWVVGDDAVQMALPFVATAPATDADRLRATLVAHLRAVRAIRLRIAPHVAADTWQRAALLRRLRARYEGERIVAFTSFAATAERLYAALAGDGGVALLTARGARTISGMRRREDILGALGPDETGAMRSPADTLVLLITTDLLSEGVNLQRASVAVHLDLPWTPAGHDQRVGRLARIGSAHGRVAVHGIAPPRMAERMLGLHARLADKRAAAGQANRPADDMQHIREIVSEWDGCRSDDHAPSACAAPAATVCTSARDPSEAPLPLVAIAVSRGRPGFLAVIEAAGRARVVGGVPQRGAWRVTAGPSDLLALVRDTAAESPECAPAVPPAAHDAPQQSTLSAMPRTALRAVRKWMREEHARAASGTSQIASQARREVLMRIDRALRDAPPHQRAELAARITALRSLIEASVGAGAEQAPE